MDSPGARGRAQVQGLLLRTLHRQKRDHCNNFCVFILPSLLVIILGSLPSIIRGRAPDIKPFEFDPRGASALRPFPPIACRYLRRAFSREEGENVRQECLRNPFEPGWTVPVLAKPADWDQLGSRNASSGDNSGILQSLSIYPFVYPPALPNSGYPFSKNQTKYDGVVLNRVLNGDQFFYQKLAPSLNSSRIVDKGFSTSTLRLDDHGTGRSPLLDLLFDSWLKGSAIGKYFGAFSFDQVQQSENRINISATIFFNGSKHGGMESFQLGAALNALESTIYSLAPNNTATARAFIRKMPRVVDTGPLPFLNMGLAIFIGLSFHFLLPIFLEMMVMERQNRIRGLMSMMGLPNLRYWIGSYISFYLLYLLSATLLIICGAAVKIGFFTLNTPVSYLVLFFIWGHNIIAFAVLLAPFFKSSDTALVVGWLYVILVNVIGGLFLGRRMRAQASEASWASIMLLPSFAFLRSVYYVGSINEGGKGVVLTSEIHLGFELGMCRGYGSFCWSYVYLTVEWFVFMILGLYFDRVLPGAVGGRQHPLFFLGFKRGVSGLQGFEKNQRLPEEEDVGTEREKAALLSKEMTFNPVDGVIVSDLRKSFYTRTEAVHAVRGISFVAKKGEIMGILGHNGAGKTTMFKMLVGEIEPTSGEAHVFGYSIASDMTYVHQNMGVTPQENILWPDLTVEEHLFFYGRLKGLSRSELKDSVEKSLAAVELTFAKKQLSSKCSGGMKRRLAVAISMTGNPSFIALDEPSTGLDILTREKLWTSIQNAKHDKTVLLTTHSLDEAESLCDRVAIMSRGKLMCIGRPEELKLRLGMGHHLTISLPDEKMADLHDAVLGLHGQAKIDTEMAGSVEYRVPKTVPLSKIVSFIETRREELKIYDWVISQSSLEDVFMSVTKRAAEQYAAETARGAVEP